MADDRKADLQRQDGRCTATHEGLRCALADPHPHHRHQGYDPIDKTTTQWEPSDD